ncbi:NAD(P)-binding protein [Gonapodya prolifera JEL478]|uniref:NAD(P)-binding protein n=1 Tax=Gonapodya prolifera (strain JEL478) TaxID=1344416 RepID=A0A139AZV8_GONPJ|nr:NAD(P)-binding protein [Gonapodya prolifera JEL478]|eukprot:KXS22276.1 NAD(P)-binding protein [Gonapodya prolifera JEL478]
MVFQVKGKSAIVTGGASGIGEALVKRLATLGVFVTVVDRNADLGNRVVNALVKQYGPHFQFVKADVSSRQDMLEVFKQTKARFGKVDIVVLNAGIDENIDYLRDETDPWANIFPVNVHGVLLGTRMAVAEFTKQKTPGVISITASMAGLYPQEYGPVYAASKGAVVHFVRGLSLSTAKLTPKVRVNCVCPGVVLTPLLFEGRGRPDSPTHQPSLMQMPPTPIETVVDAHMRAIEDEGLNGEAIRAASGKRGPELVKFQQVKTVALSGIAKL